MNPEAKIEWRLRQLVAVLVLVLTFEGICRKAAPPIYGIPIFLIKDVIVSTMAVYVFQAAAIPAIAFLGRAYKLLLLGFLPPFIVTSWYDPILAVFGAKEYLSYPIVAFAVFHGFHRLKMEKILTWFSWMSLLIIPTAMVALLELRLPHDHWLNNSVKGDNMTAYMAADELRVSSTFSFGAQYCAFLNVQAFVIMIALHGWSRRNLVWKAILLTLIPFLVVSSFVTGSRTAVAGNTAIICIVGMLALMKMQIRLVLQLVAVLGGLYLAVLSLQHFYPVATAAYSAREDGHLIGISSEIRGRIWSSFFDWTSSPVLSSFFGHGLGVMSNGSDTISSYAALWRANLWTETDFGSTLFEGGFYLVVVWYAFRFYIVMATTLRFLTGVTKEYSFSASFNQAYVIVIGAVGTLGIQPPVAIWWWFGVGTSLLLWWKCVCSPESEVSDEPPPPPPMRPIRGRSLYSEVLHPGK